MEEDHMHIVVDAAPRYSPSRIMQIIKSISAKEIFKEFLFSCFFVRCKILKLMFLKILFRNFTTKLSKTLEEGLKDF